MCFKRLALLAAAVALPGLAIAQVADKPGPLDIDANRDGKISKSEFVDGMLPQVRNRLSQRFDLLDANRDGLLDEAEMRGNRPMQRMHKGMDHGGMPSMGTTPTPMPMPQQ